MHVVVVIYRKPLDAAAVFSQTQVNEHTFIFFFHSLAFVSVKSLWLVSEKQSAKLT